MTLRSKQHGIKHAVAIKAFDRIADAWQLSPEERCQVLNIKSGSYETWTSEKRTPKFSDQQITTISKVVNIYDGLHRLFGDESYADRWIKCKNAAFDNQQPLSFLLNPNTFDRVFDYVMDALRI